MELLSELTDLIFDAAETLADTTDALYDQVTGQETPESEYDFDVDVNLSLEHERIIEEGMPVFAEEGANAHDIDISYSSDSFGSGDGSDSSSNGAEGGAEASSEGSGGSSGSDGGSDGGADSGADAGGDAGGDCDAGDGE